MSVNFNMIAPISATVISIGGLIFQMGKHSEKSPVSRRPPADQLGSPIEETFRMIVSEC